MTQFIYAPLINVNDDFMTLIEWTRPAGAQIRRGEVVAMIETAKSTAEVEAAGEGYFTPLVEPGSEIRVGQPIAALTESAGDPVEIPSADRPGDEAGEPGRSWTRKAEILAGRHGLDVASLAIETADGERVGEADVLRFLERRPAAEAGPAGMIENRPGGGIERVVIVGAGGAGAQVLDILTRVQGQRAVGLLDDDPALAGRSIYGIPILGAVSDAARLLEEGVFDAAVISIGTRTELRAEIFERLAAEGIPFTNVIDPRSAVLTDVSTGIGNVITPYVQIAASARIGDNNFFSAFVDIEHHNVVGSHCTFGPGVMTSGGVRIGDRVKFGAGVFVEPLLSIGSDSVVATGVALTRSVPERSIVKTRANFVVRSRDA